MTATDMTRLVAPLVWAEEGQNLRIGRGAFGFHRSFRIFDGVAKIYFGTIGARVTPDRARQFYDAEYVSFILDALDPAALDAMLAEARAGVLREVAAASETAQVAILLRQEPDANPVKVQMTRQAARKPILAMIDTPADAWVARWREILDTCKGQEGAQ